MVGNNHLILNVNKTKEMIVDFRRTRIVSKSISIMGEEVEMVEEYKYFGLLNWTGDAILMLIRRDRADQT